MSGDVKFLEPKDGQVARGWAAAQVATTADFSHGSWFWTQFSGGLNYQVQGILVFQAHASLPTCHNGSSSEWLWPQLGGAPHTPIALWERFCLLCAFQVLALIVGPFFYK